ncbi:MAG: hypothetical protein IJZ86_08205 [Bacteroides sp.]|nr:hypothetical protein [Bacteroides sp.]
MGTVDNGLLGGVSGKVGNLVGFRRNGKNLIRVQAARINDARTPKQLKQRRKVVLVIEFLKPLMPFIHIGYKNYAQGRSAYNAATSYLMKRCMTENGAGEPCIDLQRVMLSIGFLNGVEKAEVLRIGDKLNFSWIDNSGVGNAESEDKVLLVVYNLQKRASLFQLDVAKRADGKAGLKLPKGWSKDELMTYVTLRSADEAEVSNSIGLPVEAE